ncbi:hypothetical protein M9H77_34131 [Catharanthus roseus]|uniref:Uncharacterized protein n=1 Tax=Catharanthus roseus TaxID=4058 RepID=A0ACB9ZK88_CATRO|nr:hypothetical protein M9H77_34131 [Catharanthus roseus]
MDSSNSEFCISLQEDLIIEILRRLPVKSFIRFCCGVLHWITIPTQGPTQGTLYSFDIIDKKFEEISLPSCEFRTKPKPWIGIFNEFVSLFAWGKDFEIWVLKENFWIKEFVLVDPFGVPFPYGISSYGKILALNWDGEDVLYDLENQKVKEFVQNKVVFIKGNTNYFSHINHLVLAEYVESLISPFRNSKTSVVTSSLELIDSSSSANIED